MLRVSGMLGSSGDGPAAAEGGAGPSSGEDERMKFEDSERNSGGGGNRWPRQETLALLKIRSDMDSAFRDSSLKGPLWDEVSRKLAELGYHRNAKKCKEKFENVYKYHKRTKDGRSTKSEGKTYRFFDQLEALDQTQPSSQFPPPPQPQRSQNQGPESPTPVAMAMPTSIHRQIFPQVTIASTSIVPTNASHSLKSPITLPLSDPSPPTQPPPVPATNATVMPNDTNTRGMMNNTNAAPSHGLNQNLNTNFECDLGSSSPSSSEGEEDPERGRTKRKRKWESFFQKLMSEVIQKQEQMQKDFLKALERRERERVAREEAWRAQEMARMNREHELLAQERSIAAAKDSAVIAYLQKISDLNQQTPTQIRTQTKMQTPTLQGKESSTPNPDSALVPIPTPNPNVVQMPAPPLPQPPPPQQLQIQPYDNARNGNHVGGASSSRWPKAEVQALIQLRTNMDIKYQDNGPKGPLWEEISGEMKKIGYDRNAKRCKEKWENINKYFKKVKESNKKRPEDSKTCPYFHLLDQIYRERAKVGGGGNSMAPMMVKPEQQWPQLLDRESDEMDGEDEEEEEEEGGGYEIVTNKVQGAAESGSDVGGDGYAVGVRATWGPVVAEQMDTVKHMGGCV